MTVKAVTLRNLRKKASDTTKEYSEGFAKACEDKNVDPLKLVKLAETLELHL